MRLPGSIVDLIAQHHEGCVGGDVCAACSSVCCTRGGFAILENVHAIYGLYREGALKRKGYRFPKSLTLKDFIFTYFDVWEREVGPDDDRRAMMFFHPKSVDAKGRPITIPGPGGYWDARKELFDRNPWLNFGCVFLSHMIADAGEDDGNRRRHCILHTADCVKVLGPKPIDCLFFTCKEQYDYKTPTEDESDAWFYALAKAFPGSRERFREIVGEAQPRMEADAAMPGEGERRETE